MARTCPSTEAGPPPWPMSACPRRLSRGIGAPLDRGSGLEGGGSAGPRHPVGQLDMWKVREMSPAPTPDEPEHLAPGPVEGQGAALWVPDARPLPGQNSPAHHVPDSFLS